MFEAAPQRSTTASLPAPIGGLNTRDALANMPETDAIRLENLFPETTSVDFRRGYTSFATFTGDCETVIVYEGAAQEVFVAVDTTDNAIIDATAGGAISTPVVGGSTPTVQSLTNARFDYANLENTSGKFIVCVNGADTPLQYNGSTWSASTISGTGLTVTDLHTVVAYAERLFFAGANFDVWYLAVDAITGTATRLNIGSLFALGGRLACIVPFTLDSASELDDHLAFVSTEGEIVIYAGTDPSTAADWRRKGVLRAGRPVTTGTRAWTKVASDALLTTVDGVISIAALIAAGKMNPSIAVSDKIRTSVNTDVKNHVGNFGWELELHPTGRKLLLNVPVIENSTSRQWVMNSQTGAWCKFTGWEAFCMRSTKDTLYFGGAGVLAKADTGKNDAGNPIAAKSKQAFSYLGRRGVQKEMKMARPILTIDGPVTLRISTDVDFQDTEARSVVPIGGNAGDPWETAWDVAWSGAPTVFRQWMGVRGVGFVAALNLNITASGVSVQWAATDFAYEYGAVL